MKRTHVCSGQACSALGPTDPIPADGFVWLDLTYDEVEQLAPEVTRLTGERIFEDHLFDAANRGHPSFFDSTDHYEMIIFRGLVSGPSAERIETFPLTLFSFERLLATVRPVENRTFDQIFLKFLNQPNRVPRTPDELVHRVLSAQVDNYLDLRQTLTQRVEKWQAELLDPRRAFQDWQRLLQARSEVHRLESLCEEQHDAIQEWRDFRFQNISPELQVRMTDLIEHIQRVLSHVRRVESTIESAVQLHFSSVAHRTSEVMRALTLITAIFMPLTLITGIFGMNFEAIPLLHSPWGFWLSILGMGVVVAGLIFWFWRKRWI